MQTRALTDPPTKEERFAARLIERRGLHPPIDVVSLAREISDFKEKRFPIEIDGVCLDLHLAHRKPRIWVEERLSHYRKRFTIAHEIGHVVIPWHTGSIVDSLDVPDSSEVDRYFQMEREANRFAAELLMPRRWVISLVERSNHLQAVMRTISIAADVSPQAAAYRTLEIGPPGFVVNAVEGGIIVWSGKTFGTVARLPRSGDQIETYSPRGMHLPQVFSTGRRDYFWRKEIDAVLVPPPPVLTWRAILEEIVAEISPDKRKLIKQRLNAITAVPFSKMPAGIPVDQMFLLYLKTIPGMTADDPDLQYALSHPRFEDYALARMHERANLRL